MNALCKITSSLVVYLFLYSNHVYLQPNQVKHTPQDYINKN